MAQTVRGCCACGRNRYLVELPTGSVELAQVLFDNSNATRQHTASPLTAWLRVPLGWYRSATFAQFPDETPLTIRRTFTSPFSSSTRRQFCGYCGTQLSSWNERTTVDADYISITLGSLLDDDLSVLEEVGLLPSESDEETSPVPHHSELSVSSRGAPWFETVVENTPLGRVKRQHGGRTSRDGSVRVEWEIVEFTETDEDLGSGPSNTGKRKLGEVEAEDIRMQ